MQIESEMIISSIKTGGHVAIDTETHIVMLQLMDDYVLSTAMCACILTQVT